MVLSKEGGESSLTYGTSDSPSTASPESLMWWTTEEGTCNKNQQIKQREHLPWPQLPSLGSSGPRWLCLSNPEYVTGQEDFLKIFKPRVFPQIWEGGIPRWEGGRHWCPLYRTSEDGLDPNWVPVLSLPHQPGTVQ